MQAGLTAGVLRWPCQLQYTRRALASLMLSPLVDPPHEFPRINFRHDEKERVARAMWCNVIVHHANEVRDRALACELSCELSCV